MKLEEQKSDLERQLKTLTKQIKVRHGQSQSIILPEISPLTEVWTPLRHTLTTLWPCFV